MQRKNKDYFKDFYFSTYFKVFEFIIENKTVLKSELLYLGKKRQQIKNETLNSILVTLETQGQIKLIPLKLGRKNLVQVEYLKQKVR